MTGPGRPDPQPAARTRRSAWTRLVSDAADRHHDLRTLRVLLDLGSQPLHVNVDEPGVCRVPVAPYLLEQDLPGKYLPRLASQGDQQVELQRCQVQRLTGSLHRVPRHVNRDV